MGYDNQGKEVIPMLLEGEALAVWLELTSEQQEDYAETKKAIKHNAYEFCFVRQISPQEASTG